MGISGTGIALGTTVTTIDQVSNILTLSANNAATVSGTGTFSPVTTINNQPMGYYSEHIFQGMTTGTLTVAASPFRIRVPWACTVIGVAAVVSTAPTGSSVIVDVLRAVAATPTTFTTLYTGGTNRPTIAVNGTVSSETAPAVTSLNTGDILQVSVTQIGSTTAGSNLTVFIRVQKA
jgi:hypothetical protein